MVEIFQNQFKIEQVSFTKMFLLSENELRLVEGIILNTFMDLEESVIKALLEEDKNLTLSNWTHCSNWFNFKQSGWRDRLLKMVGQSATWLYFLWVGKSSLSKHGNGRPKRHKEHIRGSLVGTTLWPIRLAHYFLLEHLLDNHSSWQTWLHQFGAIYGDLLSNLKVRRCCLTIVSIQMESSA